MAYHKWILSRMEIEKLWNEQKKQMHPELMRISDSLLKAKMQEIYKFLIINFEKELQEGMESRLIRNALYKYAQNVYFNETNGVQETIGLFNKFNIFDPFDDQITENFIKIKK